MRLRLRLPAACRGELVHAILERLWVGGWAALNDDCAVLRRLRITHVVSVVSAEVPRSMPAFVLRHLHVVCSDTEGALLADAFPVVSRFLDDALEGGGRAFVHCGAGISRAPTAVIAFFIWKRKLPFDAAFNLVKAARPTCRPNKGFVRQLQLWAEEQEARPAQQGPREARPADTGRRVATFRCRGAAV
ncbi:protein-tyrosine phosphatase-like protein [Pelagophyceae sp. CCMP2097]|nr:protein-tyrosine phosphatase-like protein [Pelagophyceae sp. CCMP2097]